MGDPYVSVIVTAYNRRQYLPEALHSLEIQTLDKDKFEVVVVKNFKDPKSDEIIRRNRWREIIIDDEVDIVNSMLIGAEESRGPVVTFLDDDDAYVPERLAYIYAAFRNIKGLVWFHNLQHYVDEDGRPLPPELANVISSGEPPFSFILRSDDRAWIRIISRYVDVGSNGSSIAVARHVAEGLRGLRGSAPEVALAVAAGFSGGLMYHTSKRLTCQRVRRAGGISRSDRGFFSSNLTTFSLLRKYGSACSMESVKRNPLCFLVYKRLNWSLLPPAQMMRERLAVLAHSIGYGYLWKFPLDSIKNAYWPFKTCTPTPLARALEILKKATEVVGA